MAKKPRKSADTSGVTAKLQAVAKASYQRKRTTTEIIPPVVTRAKTGAWLDLISPLTEWAGLRGDELRFKRTQLRLQREDVLLEIVSRAKERIDASQKASRPLPNKFLVPFLEQASLEDPDGVLVDMWASLLESAAIDYDSHHIHFVSIMSQLSPKQGHLLQQLVGTDSRNEFDAAMVNIQVFYQSHQVREEVVTIVDDLAEKTDGAFIEKLSNAFRSHCIKAIHIHVENNGTELLHAVNVEYRPENEVDYSILQAVGLIRRVDTGVFTVGPWQILLIYYHLSELGSYFCPAVGIIKTSPELAHASGDARKESAPT